MSGFIDFCFMATDAGFPAHWWAFTTDSEIQILWQTFIDHPWGAQWWNPSSTCSNMLKRLWCNTSVGRETIERCVAPGSNVTRFAHADFSIRMQDLINHDLNAKRFSYKNYPMGLTAAQLGDAVSLLAAEQFVTNLQMYWCQWGIDIPRTADGSMFRCVYRSNSKDVQKAVASFFGLTTMPAFSNVTNTHTVSQIYEKSVFYLFQGCDMPRNPWAAVQSEDCFEILFFTRLLFKYLLA